jgi:hypothetical protein
MTMESEAVVGKLEGVRGELHEMSQQTIEMLELAWKGFRKQYKGPLELAEKIGRSGGGPGSGSGALARPDAPGADRG